MKNAAAIVLSFLLLSQLAAQKEADNWLFGLKCWANFSSGQPQVVSQPLQNLLPRGVACMSDKNGQLLYYASGQYVYNRLHQVMPQSAIRLFGTAENAPNPVLTVPFPGHDSLYYLFYFEQDPIARQGPFLRYAIINMKLQNGLGDLTVKDRLVLPETVCLKLTASLHCNKKDIWLIGHIKNSANYFSLLINSNGLSTTPVYSPGIFINNSQDYYNHQGPMKASPLGDKVAAAFRGDYDKVELMDLNSQSGILSNSKTISITPAWRIPFTNINWGLWGVEFSPTGKYLYATGTYIPDSVWSSMPSLFYQFDAGLPTQTAIQASRYLLDSTTDGMYCGMQLANNGKLYTVTAGGNKLHVVNKPDLPGTSASFARNAVDFRTGNTQFDLPYFLQSYLRYPMITTGNCQFRNIDFSVQDPVGVSNIAWDFGDPASGTSNTANAFTASHIFSTQGTYTVKAVLTNSNACGADTITKVVHAGPFKVFLGNDTTLCKGDTLRLIVKLPAAFNLWSDNSTDTSFTVTQSGKYWLRVNIGECTASDTINVVVKDLPAFTLGKDTTLCSNQSVSLAPLPKPANASYLWSTGATTAGIAVANNGDYWLKLTDAYGCVFSDTIAVAYKSLPRFSLGGDTTLCQTVLQLNATVAGGSSYVWNTGATTPAITVNQSGIYWADVIKEACAYRDSITVTFTPYPVVDLGKDTILCESATLVLDAQNPGSTYRWQNGSTGQTFLVSAKGEYFVQVDRQGCTTTDTISIAYELKPRFSLGPDQTVCNGLTVLLRPVSQTANGVRYLWQDGSSQPSYIVTQPGLYVLKLSNRCGEQSDSVTVSKGVCRLYVPTAFTPNSDGKNDVFKPSFGENIQTFSLQVYDRWGQKVFESTDMNKGWSGRLGGAVLPQGVYTWLIRYKASGKLNTEVLKGTVLLIR